MLKNIIRRQQTNRYHAVRIISFTEALRMLNQNECLIIPEHVWKFKSTPNNLLRTARERLPSNSHYSIRHAKEKYYILRLL